MTFQDLPRLARFTMPVYQDDFGSFLKINESEYARCDPFGNLVAFPFCASPDMKVGELETFYA